MKWSEDFRHSRDYLDVANIGNLIEMLRGYSLSRTIMDLFNAESYFFSIVLQSQLDLSLPRLGKEGEEKKKLLITFANDMI